MIQLLVQKEGQEPRPVTQVVKEFFFPKKEKELDVNSEEFQTSLAKIALANLDIDELARKTAEKFNIKDMVADEIERVDFANFPEFRNQIGKELENLDVADYIDIDRVVRVVKDEVDEEACSESTVDEKIEKAIESYNERFDVEDHINLQDWLSDNFHIGDHIDYDDLARDVMENLDISDDIANYDFSDTIEEVISEYDFQDIVIDNLPDYLTEGKDKSTLFENTEAYKEFERTFENFTTKDMLVYLFACLEREQGYDNFYTEILSKHNSIRQREESRGKNEPTEDSSDSN